MVCSLSHMNINQKQFPRNLEDSGITSLSKMSKKQDLLQTLPDLLDIDYVHGTIKGSCE